MTSTVGDVLRSKGRAIYSIDARRTVHDAIEQMVSYDVAALVVTDEKSELAGIITERDVAKKVVLRDRSPKLVSVKEVMTREVLSVREETPTSTCMDIMSQKISTICPSSKTIDPLQLSRRETFSSLSSVSNQWLLASWRDISLKSKGRELG